MELTDAELITACAGPHYLHMSKSTYTSSESKQTYIHGCNAGGRPDGVWIAYSSEWLAAARDFANPRFPFCCNVYSAAVDTSRVLMVNASNLEDFDKRFPDYWLNMDYYEVDFVDYLTGSRVRSKKQKQLSLEKFPARAEETFRDRLVRAGIIYDSAESAVAGCGFYRRKGIDVNRYRYKDWNAVAAEYAGVIFEWDINNPAMMSRVWYQSLDLSSGCIWDTSAVLLTQLYRKNGDFWIRM